MKNIIIIACLILTSCASEMAQNNPVLTNDEDIVPRLLYRYEHSKSCKGCHVEQYQQYEDSMHAQAFTNPLFSAQYFNDIVPRAQKNKNFVAEARKCVACHAPVVFMNYSGLVSTPEQAKRFETGVTCDFCHTLGGYGDNGDYQQVASGKKQGPFSIGGNATHHAEYSGFVQMGEFCGRCHSSSNHVGAEIKSTFDEWRESSYGMKRHACQECHMNKDGYLKNGVAEFEGGQIAHVNVGQTVRKQQEREKLYSHAFPGAHSVSQLANALQLDVRVGSRTRDASGRLPFTLVVNNERSGHKMPSGSSDLRLMWLEVTAATESGSKIPVTLKKNEGTEVDFSLAGATADDAAILENDVPLGTRLYRAVLVTNEGRQILFDGSAGKVAFDNRLESAELRSEEYLLMPPAGYAGKVTVVARLYYKGAPSSFTRKMQIPDFSKVLVAEQKKQISIEAVSAMKQ